MTMIRLAPMAAAAIFATSSAAMDLPVQVQGMSIVEYDELDMFMRHDLMSPVAREAGVSYTKLSACLKGSARHPVLRTQSVVIFRGMRTLFEG